MARKPQLLTLFIALVAMLAISACGSPQVAPTATSQPNTGQAAQPTTAPQPTEAQQQPAETQAPSAGQGGTLTVYSGRTEDLVGPLIEQFEKDTGIEVQVKYGDTAELAAALLEEGDASPADVFFAQDAGALGAVRKAGLFAPLSEAILSRVDERFRADDGSWIGVSGRARVVVYNPELVKEEDLPETIFGFTDPKWKGKIGWAPTNGSFQAFVTALRVLEGEERAREWLEGIQANEPKVYPKNTAIVEAVANGEVEVGFVNHYYLLRLLKEKGDLKAKNYYFNNSDPGALINVAGVGMLKSSDNKELAEQFIAYLVSEKAQQYFSSETFEHPLVEGVKADPRLPGLSEVQTPKIDLSDLEDLDGTLQLLQDAGVL